MWQKLPALPLMPVGSNGETKRAGCKGAATTRMANVKQVAGEEEDIADESDESDKENEQLSSQAKIKRIEKGTGRGGKSVRISRGTTTSCSGRERGGGRGHGGGRGRGGGRGLGHGGKGPKVFNPPTVAKLKVAEPKVSEPKVAEPKETRDGDLVGDHNFSSTMYPWLDSHTRAAIIKILQAKQAGVSSEMEVRTFHYL